MRCSRIGNVCAPGFIYLDTPINTYTHILYVRTYVWIIIIIIIIIIVIIITFDIAPLPYKHAQRRITFHCQRIDVDIHIVNWYIHLWTDVFSVVVWRLPHSQLPEYYLGADSIVLGHRHKTICHRRFSCCFSARRLSSWMLIYVCMYVCMCVVRVSVLIFLYVNPHTNAHTQPYDSDVWDHSLSFPL